MISTNSLSLSFLVAALGGAALFSGCGGGDDDVDPKGGGAGAPSAGAAGSGTAGTGTGGGSGGGGLNPGEPDAKACLPVVTDLITDFAPVEGKTTDLTFGDFTNNFSGGTFYYPSGTQMYALTSDVTGGNWNISGDIGDYSGFGLYLADCTKVDASAYKGLEFTISGTLEMTSSVTLSVGTAKNDIPSAWLNTHKADPTAMDAPPNFGSCIPASSQYDGTCGAPSFVVPVTSTPVTHQVMWAQLTGGKPSASVNPAEITSISFVLPPPTGAGTAAPTLYAADVTLDDVKFIP
jgi:hypothetical protein